MANKRVSLKGKGADLFFGDYAPPSAESTQDTAQPLLAPVPVPENNSQPAAQSTSRPTRRSTRRSPSRSTTRSTAQSTSLVSSKIVDRPKAFYITQRLDERLDDAVRYYQHTHGIKKVDRSVIVNAMLDNDAQWSEESLDLLVDRVISQLTSRLTGR